VKTHRQSVVDPALFPSVRPRGIIIFLILTAAAAAACHRERGLPTTPVFGHNPPLDTTPSSWTKPLPSSIGVGQTLPMAQLF